MEDVLGSLVTTIGADLSGFQSGLSTVENKMTSLASDMKTWGQNLTVGITLPIVGFLTESVKAFSDSETELAQLRAVLKSTNGVAGVTEKQALDLAAAYQKQTRYSDDAVLSTESLLLTFTGITKDVFPSAIETVLDMSTALGQDTKSSAIQLGKALQDPIEGVSALRRVGVNFNKTQMETIKNLVNTGHKAEAMQMILKELKTEFGGSAKAAKDTLGGALDDLKNNFNDLVKTIGKELAPDLIKITEFIGGLITKISALPEPILKMGVVLLVAVAAAGPLLTIFGTLLGVIGALASPIGIIIIGVGALAAAFTTNFLGIRDVVMPVIDSLKRAFNSLFSTTQDYKVKKGDTLSGIAGQFGTTVDELQKLNNLKSPNKLHIGQTLEVPDNRGLGNKLIDGIKQVLGDLGNWIATKAWPTIKGAFESWFDSVKKWISDGGATRVVKGVGDAVIKAAEWVRDHGWETLKSGFESLVTSVGTFLGGSQGLDLVGKITTAVQDAASWVANKGVPLMVDAFGKIVGAIEQVVANIAQGIIDQVNKAIAALSGKSGQYVQTKPFVVPPSLGGSSSQPLSQNVPVHPTPYAHLAKGGPVQKGRSYVVGDGGEPELLTPGANGFVTPFSAAGGGGGMPEKLDIILQADGFVDHILITIADEIDRIRKGG